jgi:hypothetical protein
MEQDGFRDSVRNINSKLVSLENEAKLYSEKLDQYLKHFDA